MKEVNKEIDSNPESEEIRILKPAMLEAGIIFMDYLQKGVIPEIKTAHYDIKTKADIAVEQFLAEHIKKHFPGVNVVGEEDKEAKVSEDMFTIDGVDGTSFFANGLKDCSITISRFEKGEVTLGMVYSPSNNEFYHAQKGQGTFLNDKRIHVSPVDDFKKAIVYPGQDIVRMYDMYDVHNRLIKNSMAHHVIASSALGYGRLADGKIHVAAHPRQSVWDWSLMILVEEAGGKVTNWQGNREFERTKERNTNILATNGLLHEQTLQLLNS